MTDKELHQHTVNAEKEVEAIATGLAERQADPQATKAITGMADILRKIGTKIGQAVEPPKARPSMDDAAEGMRQDMQPPAGPPA